MSEYSVEEVRAIANNPALLEQERYLINKCADLMADRIKADEGEPVAFRFLGPDGEAVTEWEDAPITNKKFPDLCPSIESVQYAYLHPPAQAAQAEDKVVVIREGKPTLEGIVLAAAIYMGAVKDIFKLRPEGPPYNERSVLKDTDALRAFDHLDAAGKALHAAISHFARLTGEPATQGEAVSRDLLAIGVRARNIEITRQQRAGEPNNEDHALRIGIAAALAAQPRAVPAERVMEESMAKNASRYVAFRECACSASWDEGSRVGMVFANKLDGIEHPTHEQFDTVFDEAMLAAATSPGESSRADECTCSDISFGRICTKHDRWNV